MIDLIAPIIAAVLIAPGILMALIPFLPTLTYMFVVALAFGLIDGFTAISGKQMLVLLSIVIVSIIIDHTAGLIGAKYGGARAKSLLWGIVGSIAGTFVFPPIGTFIGLFLGVLISELKHRRSHEKAVAAAGSALLGTAVGVLVNVLLAALFTGLFIYFAFF